MFPAAFQYSDRASLQAATRLLAAAVSKHPTYGVPLVVKHVAELAGVYAAGASEFGLRALCTLFDWLLLAFPRVDRAAEPAQWKAAVRLQFM